MKLTLRREAEAELEATADYYEAARPGTGKAFVFAVGYALDRIAALPRSAPAVGHGIRRIGIRGFPLGVFYVIDADEIVVLAIAHDHREPGYWRGRK